MRCNRVDRFNRVAVGGQFIQGLGVEQAVFVAAIATAAFGGSGTFARSFVDDQGIEILDVFGMVDRGLDGAFHRVWQWSGDPILQHRIFNIDFFGTPKIKYTAT
jgi:hypothetical protein